MFAMLSPIWRLTSVACASTRSFRPLKRATSVRAVDSIAWRDAESDGAFATDCTDAKNVSIDVDMFDDESASEASSSEACVA